MNKRIKELYEEASYSSYVKTDGYGNDHYRKNTDYELFAELIVRECASYMYENYPHSRYEVNYMRKHMGDPDWNKPFKEHFGVEE